MEPYLARTSSSSSSGDGYISMDVDDGFHHRHHHRRHRSSSAKEFEFQSFSSSSDADRSPADELFYMGKLLPLHLPPRLQMVHTIVSQNDAVELFATPAANTPYESCNISPSESCHVSAELNPADYFRDYAISKPATKTVTKRSAAAGGGFGSKLNWRYFKSLFSKSSGCSSQYSSAAADGKIRPISRSDKKCGNGKPAPFGEIRYKRGSNDLPDDDRRGGGGRGSHRRSFSGAFKRLSEAKHYSNSSSSSSSTISSDSNANNYRQILKRCSSSRWSPDMENPIQAAIAHCKRSQLCSRPLTAANCGDGLKRTGVCRG